MTDRGTPREGKRVVQQTPPPADWQPSWMETLKALRADREAMAGDDARARQSRVNEAFTGFPTYADVSAAAETEDDRAAAADADSTAGTGQAASGSTRFSPRIDREEAETPAAACLRPLLTVLNWGGEERHLLEALPHFDPIRGVEGLRAVLHRVGYVTKERHTCTSALKSEQFPCIGLDEDGEPLVIVERQDDDRLLVFRGALGTFRLEKPQTCRQTLFFVERGSEELDPAALRRQNWFWESLGKLKRPIATIAVFTLFANLLALLTPIYVMNVYNRVIGARSLETLAYFFVAVAAVIASEWLLRRRRSKLVAYVGTRFDSELVIQAFRQIVTMPIAMTESASIGAQISRFRQFESFREFFSGNIVNAVMDLPFTIIFFVAITLIAGPLVFVPLALVVVFAVLAFASLPKVKRHVAETGRNRTKLQTLQIEILQKRRNIREIGAEAIWRQRYEELSRHAMALKFDAQFFNMSLHTISQSLVTLAGVTTLGVGALLVINEALSVGGLIASMVFIWRILSPIQIAFLSINRISQFADTIRQINQLMRIRTERQPGQIPSVLRSFEGEITFAGVGFRYAPNAEPVVKGATFKIPAGQLVAIAGPSGAGKSTLLKLLLNLYQPQAGVISIDDLNVRQIDTGELRNAIAYVPQQNFFFYGTVSQNMLLAEPTATREDIERALREAGIPENDGALTDGLDTHLRLGNREALPEGFKQRLSIARALTKSAAIYLFDEPGTYLDQEGDKALIEKLNDLRGKATVIIVTNRPSHMNACDRVIYLREGMVVADDVPAKIVPAILNQGQKKAAG
ncbi:MAG: hypothetical protein C0606_07700 [Hyphomicrobiales bacterium]|nr:MAG: hypothetical protein C0606_07700 [Hyphomicrobiales bacterium]